MAEPDPAEERAAVRAAIARKPTPEPPPWAGASDLSKARPGRVREAAREFAKHHPAMKELDLIDDLHGVKMQWSIAEDGTMVARDRHRRRALRRASPAVLQRMQELLDRTNADFKSFQSAQPPFPEERVDLDSALRSIYDNAERQLGADSVARALEEAPQLTTDVGRGPEARRLQQETARSKIVEGEAMARRAISAAESAAGGDFVWDDEELLRWMSQNPDLLAAEAGAPEGKPSMAQRVRSWLAGLGGEEGAISFGGDKPDETERVRETLRRIIAGDDLLESIHRVSPERAQRMLEGLEGVTGDPTAPSASSRARAREFLAANPDVTPGTSQTGFEERVRSWLAGLDPPPTQAVRQQAAPALPEPAEGAITWDPRQTAEENAKRFFAEDAMERVRLDTGDWNARNLLAYMDPKEFLGLARQFVGGAPTKPESIDAVRAALAAGKPITDVPLLSFDPTTGQVTGHEGRHRATVLSEEGVPRMPVRLIGESDSAVYFDEQTNPGAWGYAEELPPTLRGEPQDVFYGGALNPYSIETPYYTEGPLRGTLRPEYAGAWRQQAAGLGGGGGSISARPGLLLGPNYPLGRGHPGWDRAAYGEFGGAFNDPPGWIPGRAFRAVHQQAAPALPEPAGAAPPRLISALTGQPVPDMPGGRGPRRVGAPAPYYTEGPLRGADAKAPAPFRGDNVGDASRGLLSPARYASEVADGASGLALRRLIAAGLGEGLGAALGYALAPNETTPMEHFRGVEGDVASALGLPQRSQMPIFSLAPDRAAAVEAVEGQVGARPAPEVHRARVGGAAYPDWGASPVTEEERRVYLDNLSNLGLPLPDWAAWDVRPSAPPAIEWEDPVEVDAGGGVTWRGKRRRKPDQPTIEELGGPYRQTQSRWGDVLQ